MNGKTRAGVEAICRTGTAARATVWFPRVMSSAWGLFWKNAQKKKRLGELGERSRY